MFIKPNAKYDTKVELKVTHESNIIFTEYARYIGVTPDELFVKVAIDKMLKDEEFLKAVESKRYNKKIMKFMRERKYGMFEVDSDDESSF